MCLELHVSLMPMAVCNHSLTALRAVFPAFQVSAALIEHAVAYSRPHEPRRRRSGVMLPPSSVYRNVGDKTARTVVVVS